MKKPKHFALIYNNNRNNKIRIEIEKAFKQKIQNSLLFLNEKRLNGLGKRADR